MIKSKQYIAKNRYGQYQVGVYEGSFGDMWYSGPKEDAHRFPSLASAEDAFKGGDPDTMFFEEVFEEEHLDEFEHPLEKRMYDDIDSTTFYDGDYCY